MGMTETSISRLFAQSLYQSLASDSVVLANFDACVQRIARCDEEDRVVYVTGIGKSGIVAQRLASTLASISIRSRVRAVHFNHTCMSNVFRTMEWKVLTLCACLSRSGFMEASGFMGSSATYAKGMW